MPAPDLIVPRYFTAEEAARLLRMNARVFSQILASGNGPETVSIGRKGRLIRDDQLVDWAAAQGIRLVRR